MLKVPSKWDSNSKDMFYESSYSSYIPHSIVLVSCIYWSSLIHRIHLSTQLQVVLEFILGL